MTAFALAPSSEINRIWSMINRISNPAPEAKSGANPVKVSAVQTMCLEINRIYRIYIALLTHVRGGEVRGCCGYASRTCACKAASLNPVNPVDLRAPYLTCDDAHRICAGFGLRQPDSNPAHIRDLGDGTIRASRHLITTPVTATIHARCGALTLTGHAEGLPVRADTAALNTAGEIAALCDGLNTYTLLRSGLVHRDAGRIAGRHLSGPVLAEHRCGRTIPAAHRDNAPQAATAAADPDRCPF